MTREEAIKYIEQHNHIDDEVKDMCIEALVADTNVGGKWIPCSENLPENTRTVIVDVEELRNPTFAFYMKLSKKWVLVERDFIYLEDLHVLAWQPLPEPYKEE